MDMFMGVRSQAADGSASVGLLHTSADGLPEEMVAQRKVLARTEIEHFIKLLEDPPIGIQIGIVTDTLPHAGFQVFRQPDRKVLVLSPFRLGGEPNVRVGVAMITSAPDALAFHEAAINEMWGRALKGQTAANLVRHQLASKGKPLDYEQLAAVKEPAKRRTRNKPAGLLM
jgi:hypothetical protein